MSNKSAPHRKFVQTFILAEQPNGYFVLNDIFRYINDEDDVDAEIDGVQEPVAASSEESAIEPTTAEEPKVLTSSADPTEQQYDADSTVHQRGQKVLKQGHASDEQHLDEIKANGIHSTESVDSKNDGPIKPEVLRSPVTELSPEPAAPAPTQEVSEKEKPKEAVTTRIASPTASGPAAAPQATTASVAPAKPAAPKTWAKLVATSTSAVPPTLTAAASTPSASVLSKSTPSSEKHAARLDPAHSQPHQSQGSVGWQTAGNDHAKRQTRPQSVSGGVEKETVLAYVRNVTEKVSTDALKAALTAYGELAYFDVSRQKVSPSHLWPPRLSQVCSADIVAIELCLCRIRQCLRLLSCHRGQPSVSRRRANIRRRTSPTIGCVRWVGLWSNPWRTDGPWRTWKR